MMSAQVSTTGTEPPVFTKRDHELIAILIDGIQQG